MDIEKAKTIQTACLEKMKKGGLEPMERMDCFAEFETTNPSVELVKEFYDVWAADYDTDMKVVDYKNTADVANAVAELFSDAKDVKVLDVGAGTGVGGKLLSEKGYTNIDATDGSPGMLTLAKQLGCYKNVLQAEVLIKDQPMRTIEPETYDIIASSGSFYPFHLQGYHLPCFLDCAKTGGHIIISSCPNSDKDVGLKPVVKKLADDGVIEVVKETYIPKWYRDDDGTLFVLKKLKKLRE